MSNWKCQALATTIFSTEETTGLIIRGLVTGDWEQTPFRRTGEDIKCSWKLLRGWAGILDNIVIARGSCVGLDRALDQVERAYKRYERAQK